MSETAGRWGLARARGIGRGVLRPVSVLGAVLMVALLVQAVRLIWVLVTPAGPYGDWTARPVAVLDPEARASLLASLDAFDRRASAAGDEATVTSLDITLYGLRLNEASGKGSAIVAGSDGVQRSVSVGEEVVPGVTLAEVRFDHVVLDRGGARESLYLDQSVPAETVGAAPATAEAAPVLNAETLTAGLALVPRMEEGRITGLAVSPKGDGKIFALAGFRAGDIINQINGRPIASANDANLLTQLVRPGTRVSLMVERGSDTLPIALIIPEP